MAEKESMNRRSFLKRGLTYGGAAAGGAALALSAPAMWRAAAEMIQGPQPVINGIGLADPKRVQLSLNENPFGASPAAIEAVSERMFGMSRYPFHNRLEEALADFLKMPEDHIFVGGGSTEILNIAVLSAFEDGGGHTITGQPSYFDVPSRTTRFGGEVKRIPTTASWGLDLSAMSAAIDEDTRLINICNPNNPTGQILDAEALEQFIRNVPERVLVLVDEAYVEFAGEDYRSMIPLTGEIGNLLVVRTFSKVYGLAGARIGYGVAQPALLARLKKYSIGDMNKNTLAIEAALASLGDQAFVRHVVEMTRQGREYLYSEIETMGHAPVRTATNFMPVKTEGSANWLLGQLVVRNVHITQSNGMDGHIRISVGRPHENEALIAAMKNAADSFI